MKYVFIGNGTDDIKSYYIDFNRFDYSELVMLPSSIFNLKLNWFGSILFCLEKTKFHNTRLAKRSRRLYNRADFYRTNKKVCYNFLDSIKKVAREDEVIFIIYARIYEYSGTLVLKYLKKKYPKSKFVIYFGDVMNSYSIYSIDRMRKDFSEIFTFDKSEAEKYNFKFLQEPFSFVDYGRFDNEYDITFVGAAKNRLDEIYLAYEKAKNLGFKNDFHIFNVSDPEMKYKDEISFNKWMPFSEVMEHVLKSKAIFEVVQKDGFSPTTRYAEALLYKKYLITNCKAFRDKKDLPQNIIYFENPEDIDFSKINRPLEYDNEDYIKKLSIETYIKTIDSFLN